MSYTPNMNGPSKVTIVSHGLAPSQNPQRAGQLDFFVIYQLDPLHRFTVFFPKHDVSEAEIDQAVRTDYQKQKSLINREVNV